MFHLRWSSTEERSEPGKREGRRFGHRIGKFLIQLYLNLGWDHLFCSLKSFPGKCRSSWLCFTIQSKNSRGLYELSWQHEYGFLFWVGPSLLFMHPGSGTSKTYLYAVFTIETIEFFLRRWICSLIFDFITLYFQTELPLTVDPLLASGNPSVPVARRHLGDSLDHRLTVRWNNFVSTTDSRCLIACGYPDYSFRVIDTDSGEGLGKIFLEVKGRSEMFQRGCDRWFTVMGTSSLALQDRRQACSLTAILRLAVTIVRSHYGTGMGRYRMLRVFERSSKHAITTHTFMLVQCCIGFYCSKVSLLESTTLPGTRHHLELYSQVTRRRFLH